MGLSPRRRRRKPRHARPRATLLARVCEPCLGEYLQLALGPASHLTFLQPHGHWLMTAGSLALLGVRLAGHRAGHHSAKQLH